MPESPLASSSRGWWYALTAVLPLLYLLSIPPLYFSFLRTTSSSGAFDVPGWVRFYIGPYMLLTDIPLLAEPMRTYFFWWAEVLDARGVW
ncbi:hypothetical protein DES53_104361 [Roseimicrobium gellanilyticum]|uniref:Uncharacterized protein n=1 Tax=Roseimicrobium gellanilyticum TaxID=748857 RepID=A0A366HQ00_9BACT|nr:hypothetical protein [Roseimicrobium gellanilyticum]RBP44540.1 hypothetical protein DES53_104361 [Roseimicrobium gellanilyticum]